MNVDTIDIKILLVDDEKKFLDSISERIRLKGLEPLLALSGEEAIEIAKRTNIDLAVVDLKMPGMDGITTITKLKEIHPEIKTVLLTAYGNEKIKEAAEALDSAYFEKDEMRDFWNFIKQFSSKAGMIIIKPPSDQDAMAFGPKDGDFFTDQRTLKTEAHKIYAGRQTLEKSLPFADIDASDVFFGSRTQKLIGETPSILELKKDIQNVASLDCPVLIVGEGGTGKKLVARTIHMLSPRKEKKFLAVNCGSFGEELLDHELFGHEKKALTGACHYKRGIFEATSGGTLLLGEIGDTSPSLQVKLLRVLQEKTIIRIGGADEVPVDVRVLAATNQNLKREINKGEFCEDLYSRLNTFVLFITPLRERRNDILLLSSYFLYNYRKQLEKQVKKISDEALAILMKYPFPGNVRELENAIENAVIMCDGNELRKEHLPQRFLDAKQSANAEKKNLITLSELERRHIIEVLKVTKGNKSEASRILGICRASLWRKLKEIDESKSLMGM